MTKRERLNEKRIRRERKWLARRGFVVVPARSVYVGTGQRVNVHVDKCDMLIVRGTIDPEITDSTRGTIGEMRMESGVIVGSIGDFPIRAGGTRVNETPN